LLPGCSYCIFDLYGKKVGEGNLVRNGLDISHLPPGLYSVQFCWEGKYAGGKFVVQ
jgi:hypothetical protein